MDFKKVDWATPRFPQVLLRNEPTVRDTLQNIIGDEAAIFRVEQVNNNEYDYRIMVSAPVRDELIDKVEQSLGTKKIDWVLVRPEPVQHY